MTLPVILSFAAAYFSLILAFVVLVQQRKAFSNKVFALGMILLAAEEMVRGVSYRATVPEEVVQWEQLRILVASLIPGIWLIFSLSYARSNFKHLLSRWKWTLLAVFVLPLLLATIFRGSLFPGSPVVDRSGTQDLQLGGAGWAFYLISMMSIVLILANLERTLRVSTGRTRWQIKFMILGVAVLFALRIYTGSQALLFSASDSTLGSVHTIALLAANLLFTRSLFRAPIFDVGIYLSRATIQNSLTILLSGAYLVTVGVLAQLARSLNLDWPLPLDAFLIFFALTGLAILLLSDRLRQRLKRFVGRHFIRPRFDYRKEWMELTERTTSLVDVHELCSAVAKMISETLDTLSVNIWLKDSSQGLALAGSTVFSESQAKDLEKVRDGTAEVIQILMDRRTPLDFTRLKLRWPQAIMLDKPEYFRSSRIRYAVPLQARGELVGLMTLNDDRVGGGPLTIEDLDLLQTLGAQLAGSLLNLKLLDRLRAAKEVEAFQNVSAFFVHDLKNLAARLSLTMQNLSVHFDNPEFRADALRVIAQSLNMIEDMCNRLSMLKQKIELNMVESDLNALVLSTLKDLQSSLKTQVERNLRPIPNIQMDPEQLQKVLINLILNANDAIDGEGQIFVETAPRNSCVMVSVSDNGCGMSQEFSEKSLFRPFKTTKKGGLGIGLFHSKLIVEAHRGRIEVESSERSGSTFLVILPVQ
jgi:putative PEP-CTERM system histidine kinase